MEDNKKQTKSEYVENSVRAMRDMYQAEGQPFNESEARANAEKEWERSQPKPLKNMLPNGQDGTAPDRPENKPKPLRQVVDNSDVVKHIESLRNGGNDNADKEKEDKKGRIRSALSSVLNGQAFKDRIGR